MVDRPAEQSRGGGLPVWVVLLLPAVAFLLATGLDYHRQLRSDDGLHDAGRKKVHLRSLLLRNGRFRRRACGYVDEGRDAR